MHHSGTVHVVVEYVYVYVAPLRRDCNTPTVLYLSEMILDIVPISASGTEAELYSPGFLPYFLCELHCSTVLCALCVCCISHMFDVLYCTVYGMSIMTTLNHLNLVT